MNNGNLACLTPSTFTPFFLQAQVPGPTWDTSNWNKTTSIKELPFCALILRESHDRIDATHTIHVLMEPDEVTANNLGLLFGVLSQRDAESPAMVINVATDVTQLAPLATGGFISGSSLTKSDGAKEVPLIGGRVRPIRQMAIFRRNKFVAFFRYNPDYPKGESIRTVIMWGREHL